MSKREVFLGLGAIIFFGFIAICICIYLMKRIILKKEEYEKANKMSKTNYKRYNMAIEALNGSIWEWDDKSKILYLSSTIKDILQVKSNIDTFGKLFEFIVPKDRARVEEIISNICNNKIVEKFDIQYTFKNTKGKEIIINLNGIGRFKEGVFYLAGIINDITEKVKQQQLIEEGNKKYKLVVEGSSNIIFCIDIKKEKIIFDKKIVNYFQYNHDSCIELHGEVIITLKQWEFFIFSKDVKSYREKIQKLLYGKDTVDYEVEYRLVSKENKIVWVHASGKRSMGDDGKMYVYGSLIDITDIKEKELKIYFMSYYDEVTGIANRRLFVENVNKSLESNKGNESIAIIFIDLDNFKYINDTYGHNLGDSLLEKFCEEMYGIIDENSHFARLGGDEFVIAKTKIKNNIEVEELIQAIIKRFNDSIKVDGKDVYCTLSIGVSLYPFDGENLDSLLKRADIAMYKAKANGKNRYQFFDINLLKEFNRDFEIEKGLRTALDKNEIIVLYQAKVNTFTEEVVGYESLARWNSSELGIVSPTEFIPIAERTGLIINIGKSIIEESIKRCKQLSLTTNKKFKIAINLSGIQIRDDEIVDFVSDTLKAYNLPPSYIEFEITESIIMKSVDKNIDILKKLKKIGVSIALDDFGTGYSSLSYLKILPIDVLKIDKSFIDGISIDKKSEYIIEKIVDLSHCLDIVVVAEGVETKKQVEYLKSIKCDIIQGYYYSKPKPFELAKKMMLIDLN